MHRLIDSWFDWGKLRKIQLLLHKSRLDVKYYLKEILVVVLSQLIFTVWQSLECTFQLPVGTEAFACYIGVVSGLVFTISTPYTEYRLRHSCVFSSLCLDNFKGIVNTTYIL